MRTSLKKYSLIYSIFWPVILVWPVLALAGIIGKNILDPVDPVKTLFLWFKELRPALMEQELPPSDLPSLRLELAKDMVAKGKLEIQKKNLDAQIARRQEQIFLEEGRVGGNYRQAALPEGESGGPLKEVKETLCIK